MVKHLIIKTILNKFEIHPLFYLISLITILTGHFKEFIMFSLLITIHEIGHFLTAYYYKWNILKVKILPFGGITIFNDKINRPLKEEFLILIMGPIIQLLGSFLLYLIIKEKEILLYSNILLVFNLIPIYPMDGSKLFNLFLNKFFSFKKSLEITLYISYLFLFFLLFLPFNLFIILIFMFLFLNLIKETKNINLTYNKFLFERYLYKINFIAKQLVSQFYSPWMMCLCLLHLHDSSTYIVLLFHYLIYRPF